MYFRMLTLAITTGALCTLAAATPSNIAGPGQREHQNTQHQNAAQRSGNSGDEQRSQQLHREAVELLHQAEQKNQQAKALIRQEKGLKAEEISQEHSAKGDHRAAHNAQGAERRESGERSQLNRQAEALEKERAALIRQANEKERERKGIEAHLHGNRNRR
jgi:hypothetical protein